MENRSFNRKFTLMQHPMSLGPFHYGFCFPVSRRDEAGGQPEVCEKTCMAWSAWYAHPWASTSRALHTTCVHGKPRCCKAACRLLLCGEFAGSTMVHVYFITSRVGGQPRGRPPSTLTFLAGGSHTQGKAEPE